MPTLKVSVDANRLPWCLKPNALESCLTGLSLDEISGIRQSRNCRRHLQDVTTVKDVALTLGCFETLFGLVFGSKAGAV